MINLRRVRKLVESNNDLTLKESVVDKKKQLFIEGKDSSFKLKVNLNENNCDIVILDDENNSIEEYEAPMANSQELVDAISNALQLYDVIDEIAPEIKSTEVTNSDPVLDAPNKDEEENKETNGTAEELIVVATEPELELVAPEDIEEVIEVPDEVETDSLDKELNESHVDLSKLGGDPYDRNQYSGNNIEVVGKAYEDLKSDYFDERLPETDEAFVKEYVSDYMGAAEHRDLAEYLRNKTNTDDLDKEIMNMCQSDWESFKSSNEIEEEFLGVSDEVRKDSIEKGLVSEDECLHTDELEDLEDVEASKFDVPDYLDKAIAELEAKKDNLEEENKIKLSNVINALKTEKFLIENIIKK